MRQQGKDGGEDGNGDKQGAGGVGDEEAEALDEDRGDYHAYAAQGVSQNVKENA